MVERGDQPEAESGGAALCRVCGGEEGPCLASTFPACFSFWRCLCVPWCPVTWFSLALVCFTLWKESSFSHLSLRVDWNQLYSQPPSPKIKNNFQDPVSRRVWPPETTLCLQTHPSCWCGLWLWITQEVPGCRREDAGGVGRPGPSSGSSAYYKFWSY